MLLYSEFPGRVHQLAEDVVALNLGGDGSVVVVPVVAGDHAVVVLVTEAGEELDENIVDSAVTSLNLGVVGAVKHLSELSGADIANLVDVEFIESGIDDLLAGLIGASTDTEEELVEVNVTVLGGVEVFEEAASLTLGDVASEVLEAPVELLFVDESVVV